MRFLLLPLAALLVGPALAQDAPPAGAAKDDDIIVLGREQRERHVRALSGLTGRDPIARFDSAAICPGVVGLTDAQNSEVATRMRKVAEAVGIEVAKPECRTNALVIVARDKEEMIAALEKAHPAWFTEPSGRIRTPKQPGPVTAWHLIGFLDRDGVPVPYDQMSRRYVLEGSHMPSRIGAAMRPIYLASVVVIQLDAALGLTPMQLADYAAMRSYAKTDPARAGRLTAPTILTIIDAPDNAEVPLSMTHWDLSYLRGLYATVAEHYAAAQKNAIRQRMEKDVAASEGAAEE